MRAKSSGGHALRIPVSEGYKQKEATATRLRLLAGVADAFCSVIEQVFVSGRMLLDLPPGTLEVQGIPTDLCSTTFV
jgi:hypothetical protein